MRFEEMLATRCPPGHRRREAGAWRRLAEAEAEIARLRQAVHELESENLQRRQKRSFLHLYSPF